MHTTNLCFFAGKWRQWYLLHRLTKYGPLCKMLSPRPTDTVTRESRRARACFSLAEDSYPRFHFIFRSVSSFLHTQSESREPSASVSPHGHLCSCRPLWVGSQEEAPLVSAGIGGNTSWDQRTVHFPGPEVPKQDVQCLLTRPCCLEVMMATHLYEAVGLAGVRSPQPPLLPLGPF